MSAAARAPQPRHDRPGGAPPAGWRRVRLGDHLSEVAAGVGPEWRRYRVVGATRGGLAPAKESVGKAPERYKLVLPRTIFYNPMRILIGSIAMIDDGEEPGITSPDYVVFTTNPDVIHHRWFYYWLRSRWGEDFIRTLARGAVRERMLFRRLAGAELDVPPLSLQATFAERVRAMARARVANNTQLQVADHLYTAYLRTTFCGTEAAIWPRRALADLLLAPIKTGISKPSLPHSQKRCLTLSAVRAGLLDLNASKPVEVSDAEATRNWVRPGVWYVVRGNGNRDLVARGGLAPTTIATPVLYPDLLFEVVNDSQKILTEYLRLVWDSPEVRQDIESRARTSAGIYKINQANLASIRLPVPPVTTQARVALELSQKLQHVRVLQQALSDLCTAIQELPAALIRADLSERV